MKRAQVRKPGARPPLARVILPLIALSAVLSGSPLASAAGPATVKPQVIRGAGDAVTVNILTQGVENLGGYQLVLSWDPALVKFENIQNTQFLGTSGRRPDCPPPVTQAGAVRLACVTFNPATPGQAPSLTQVAGVAGDGTLAKAQFRLVKSGKLQFRLTHVILVNPLGTEIPSTTSDISVPVSSAKSSNTPLFIGIGVAAAAVLVLLLSGLWLWRRRRRRPPSESYAGVGAPYADDPEHRS
ncbi:MAG: hypothetical protein IVW36_11405 [Dehalococcoidia bacterium]|nr:hypothetical protein [Dehalococcoidia bacterium]